MQQAQVSVERSTAAGWRHDPNSWLTRLLVFASVGVLYFLAGWLGLLLLRQPEGIAVFWPASGLAAGVLLVLGKSARLPVALAVIVATAVANLQSRSSLGAIVVFSLCNALECLLFAWSMDQLDHKRERLESLASLAVFVLAAGLSAAIAALLAALAIQVLGLSPAPLLKLWLGWFQSDALGILAVAPVIILLVAMRHNPPRLAEILEGSLGVVVAVGASLFAFGFIPLAAAWPMLTPASVLFPVFLWLAGRTPAAFTAIAAFANNVVIVAAAVAGVGRLNEGAFTLLERLTAAQISMLTSSVAALTLAAMFARIRNVAADLQASEQRLKLALVAGGMYAFEFDLGSGVVRRTGGLIDRLGLPPRGTIEDYFRALHRDDRRGFEAMLRAMTPEQPQVLRQLHLSTPDGRVINIEHRAEAVFDARGRIIQIRGTCVDVTEREAGRQALEERERQLSGALEAGRVFAFDFDVANLKVQRSENSFEILGVTREQAQSSPNLFMEMVHTDDRRALIDYRYSLSPTDPFTSQSFRYVRPDGRIVWLELTATGEFGTEGELQRIRGLARDVTERRRAEQRQEKLIEELDHRVKNALARMAVVIRRTREGHVTLDDYVASIQGRIESMKRTQERLSNSHWTGASLISMVTDELAPYRTPDNCVIDGPDLVLEPNAAQAFSFTLHELATNAAKHGALSTPDGRVSVNWKIETHERHGRVLVLSWREVCAGTISPPTHESYGLSTIRNLLRYEHKAKVETHFMARGLHCEIALPLDAVAAAKALPA